MKRVILTSVVFGVLLVFGFAHAKTDVSVRSSKQDGVTRLVFDTEETFVKGANVTSSETQINIEFPSDFSIMQQKGFDLEISTKGRVVTINIKEPFEIKVLRLSSPARLVIDVITSKTQVDIKPKTDVALPQKVFVLDPGHGGFDSGITEKELKEKDVALSIVRDIEALLIKKDKKVFLTRRGDQFISLRDRAIFANQKIPEIFVSIHVSTSGTFALYIPVIVDIGSEQSAVESYGLNSRQRKHVQKSKKLAEDIGKAIKDEFNLGVIQREMSLPVINSVNAPAVLIEVPSFKIMGYDPKTRLRLAEAIIRGFSYYGQ